MTSYELYLRVVFLLYLHTNCVETHTPIHTTLQHIMPDLLDFLRMHEEASYEGLDFVECEVRRRTFWLLFGGARNMINEADLPFDVMLLSFCSGQVHVHPPRSTNLS